MSDGWSEDCREPRPSVVEHWLGFPETEWRTKRLVGVGERLKWREDPAEWVPVYEPVTKHCPKGDVDEFKADIHFAVWGFRNQYVQELRHQTLGENALKERKRHKKVCSDALHALNKLTGLGDIFRDESAPLRHALKAFIGRLEGDKTEIKDEPVSKSNGGNKPRYAVNRLILTLENRWIHFTGCAAKGETWVDFVKYTLIAAGYPKRGETDALINTAKNRKYPLTVAPVGDLEFIHPTDDLGRPLDDPESIHPVVLLYLRNAPNALKVYEIGRKFLFIHRNAVIESDTTLGQMFYVDWEN